MKKTLDSIAEQIFTDFEIILTDDSPDDTVEKLVSTYNFEGKLKYSRNSPALGTPENWNEAIRRSSGEYIKIMHHDDWFENANALKAFVELLDNNKDANLAFSATKILDVKTNAFSYNNPSTERIEIIRKDPTALFYGNSIGAPSATIFRRSVNTFFDTRMKYVVDTDFYIRVLTHNPKLAFCTTPLIVNVSNWEEQVTQQTVGDKSRVIEFCLLYSKIRKNGFPSVKQLEIFRGLFIDHNIRSLKDFRNYGIVPPEPAFIFGLLIQYLKIRGRYK